MLRSALIVAGSAGPPDVVDGLLERVGFGPSRIAASVAEALTRLHVERVDLLVIPVRDLTAGEFATLERELRAHHTTFVIGTAGTADAELILRAMRAGVHEFLVSPPEPNAFASAVDRLLRRSAGVTASGTTIAVYSAKGGLGTTTIAVNLAFALAAHRKDGRVALADMVAGGGDVRVMLNLQSPYDMGDLVKKVGDIDAELLQSLMSALAGGVWALPSSDELELADALDGAATVRIIDQLRSYFAYTVLDCEHHLSDRTLATLDSADQILLVTQLGVACLRSTQRTLTLCRRLGYDEHKIHVVVNRVTAHDTVTMADAARVLGRAIFFAVPNDYKTCARALATGVPLAEYNRRSPLVARYGQLAARVAGRPPAATPVPRASNNGNGRPTSAIGRLFGVGRVS
ncbi:MAG TPA: AAA family ATPase [Gemmatimonadaceae bacterium]|nr:AAA family ATPase [Gemmatimonadaceae bacterium]